MEDNNKGDGIIPERLDSKTRFSFRCHKGVSCFTECCRGINIVLTPYDIVRLKTRLGLSSTEFLAMYTVPEIWEKTNLPLVTLKQMDDERKSCVFVKENEGCLVYTDRPSACRYYPIGVAALAHKEGAEDNDFYFFVHEPHCRGFEEDQDWNVAEWRKDQGVDIHDEINEGWTDLIVRKRSFPPNIQLTEQTRKMFFTACYDVDAFRSFVFDTSFLERYEIDTQTLDAMKTDDVALIRFAFKWLTFILYKIGDIKMRSGK